MAAGWPTKANYATGDVLSATNMNDLSGTVNLINPTAKGDLYAGSAANTYTKLAVGANNTVLTADSTTATGLKWATAAGGGKVLQVVTAVYGTTTTNTSLSFTDTGLTATITPTLSTSKILVLISQQMGVSRTGTRAYGGWQYLRGATVLNTGTAVGGVYVGGSEAGVQIMVNATYLDSPATTSATTYKTQSAAYESGTTITWQNELDSVITLMEIGA